MNEKDKIKALEKQVELLEKIIELQKLLPPMRETVVYPPYPNYPVYPSYPYPSYPDPGYTYTTCGTQAPTKSS